MIFIPVLEVYMYEMIGTGGKRSISFPSKIVILAILLYPLLAIILLSSLIMVPGDITSIVD